MSRHSVAIRKERITLYLFKLHFSCSNSEKKEKKAHKEALNRGSYDNNADEQIIFQ